MSARRTTDHSLGAEWYEGIFEQAFASLPGTLTAVLGPFEKHVTHSSVMRLSG